MLWYPSTSYQPVCHVQGAAADAIACRAAAFVYPTELIAPQPQKIHGKQLSRMSVVDERQRLQSLFTAFLPRPAARLFRSQRRSHHIVYLTSGRAASGRCDVVESTTKLGVASIPSPCRRLRRGKWGGKADLQVSEHTEMR